MDFHWHFPNQAHFRDFSCGISCPGGPSADVPALVEAEDLGLRQQPGPAIVILLSLLLLLLVVVVSLLLLSLVVVVVVVVLGIWLCSSSNKKILLSLVLSLLYVGDIIIRIVSLGIRRRKNMDRVNMVLAEYHQNTLK